MKNNNYLSRIFHTIILILATGLTAIVSSQPAINTNVTPEAVNPGETLTITLDVSEPVDAFFFATRVTYNPEYLEFISLEAAGILDDPGTLTFHNDYPSSEIGISVTRTASLPAAEQGELAALTFRVKNLAAAGLNSIGLSDLQLSDSAGDDIDIIAPEEAEFTVNTAIGEAALDMPAEVTIQSGESFETAGRIFASTITDGDDDVSGLTVWVGLNTEDSDPSSWSEDVWEEMSFESKESDGFAVFTGEIGFMRERESFYVAIRAQLGSDEFVYGGRSDTGGGIWNGTENVSALFTVTEPDAFRYILANWDFDDDLDAPSVALPVNETSEIQIAGASRSGSGFSSGAANANGWDAEAGTDKFWLVKVSTERFENLQFSSKQAGSGTGPKDFQIQISTDSTNWQDLPGGTLDLSESSSAGNVENLELPAEVNNRESLYIRWLNTSSLAIGVDDSTGIHNETGTTGTNRIDDIVITGTSQNRQEIAVWPGDTDDSGVVTETDVLPLGINWQRRGPIPLFPTIEWVSRIVEKWATDTPDNSVTASDANGDGIVNERDLQVIGLNFGQEQDNPPAAGGIAAKIDDNYSLRIDQLEADETIRLIVAADQRLDLIGTSFRLNIQGIDDNLWDISKIEPPGWAENWLNYDKILSFEMINKETGVVAGSYVHKGRTENSSGLELVAFEIKALADWPEEMKMKLADVSVIDSSGKVQTVENAIVKTLNSVSVEDPISELPQKTQLIGNYPNPFNPSTIIRYELANRSNVTLAVYDVIGRKVAVLINNQQLAAGNHEVRFDAAGLASGLYLYRLQADQFVQSRQMMLIK